MQGGCIVRATATIRCTHATQPSQRPRERGHAVQHGIRPSGPLRITLRGSRDDAGHICLTLSDDGQGISAAELPHVLDAGFGSGLGIALKNVDDRLKGHFGPESGILISSVEGEGATVTLTLMPEEIAEAL